MRKIHRKNRRSAARRLSHEPLENRRLLAGSDAFATATVLAGASASDTGSTVGFTGEVDEPNHAGVSGTLNSAWWQWTASNDGTVSIETCGSDYDTTLAVYTGTALNALTPIAGNDDACGLQSRVSFAATAGTNYAIAVDGFGSGAGNVALSIELFINNDDFADAIVLSGTSVTTSGSNVGFTGEVDEPNHAGTSGTLNSAWWQWTAPASNPVTIETCGSSYDTTLAVYTGSAVNALTQVAGNDDACGLQSGVGFTATSGTTYYIAVDGYAGSTGTIALSLEQIAPPANDDFANAATLVGDSDSDSANTVGATGEVDEPNHAGVAGTLNSVWWQWTSPSSGQTVLETCSSSYDTVLAVYTGTAVNALTQIAANDDACGLQSGLTFASTAGTIYSIVVDGYGAATGNAILNLVHTPAPPNDDFANAFALSGDFDTATGTNVGAGGEVGEPNHAGISLPLQSVWWTWTAPHDGTTRVETCGSGYDSSLAVYTGTAVNALAGIAANDDACGFQSGVVFPTVAGETYQIAVDSYSGNSGPINLTLDSVLANVGGPYMVDEGSTIPLDGTGSAGSSLTYDWDLDNDGQFDDATGTSPSFSAATLDGPTSVTIGLRVTGITGVSDTSFTTVTVNNVPPVAVADAYTIDEDSLLMVTALGSPAGVLDNDTDAAPADTLSVTQINGSGSLTGASLYGAVVSMQSDGSFSYDPRNAAALQVLASGESLTDSFSYTVQDDDLQTASGTVSIVVSGQDAIEVNTTFDFVAPVSPTNPGDDASADTVRFDLVAGTWEIRVNGGLLRTTSSLAAPIEVFGSSDDDSVIFNGLASGSIAIDGGSGTNWLMVDDSADATGDAVVIDSSSVNGLIDGGASLTHTGVQGLTLTLGSDADQVDLNSVGGSLADVTVNGSAGDDTFDATPNPLTRLSLNGDSPALVSVGDVLNLDLSAVSLPIVFPATMDGTYTSTGNQDIQWTSIEQFTVNGQPFVTGDLFVEGTLGRDRIAFSAAARGQTLTRVNDDFYGPFLVTGTVVAYGGPARDRMTAAGNLPVPVEFHGGEGGDYLAGGTLGDTLFGDDGNDQILAGEGDNTLYGGNGNDFLSARGGNDSMFGDQGNDRLNGDSGDDLLEGGIGNDQLLGSDGNDLLIGGIDSDPLFDDGNDLLSGGRGDDVLVGLDGNDIMRGGTGNDLLIGGNGADLVAGEGGDDALIGGGGTNENDLATLISLLSEWTTSGTHTTIDPPLDDGGELDNLVGGGGLDEFNLFAGDTAADAVLGEMINNLP